jgi:branched-chain amino acid transport system permease protein
VRIFANAPVRSGPSADGPMGWQVGLRRINTFGTWTLAGVLVAVVWLSFQGLQLALTLGILIGIYAILGMSLNLLIGFSGILSLGHTAFYGIGAYVVAILTADPTFQPYEEGVGVVGLSWFQALPIAMLTAGMVALVTGVVISRFRGEIVAVVSFGLAIIAHSTFSNWLHLTRGPFGISGIPRPSIGEWRLEQRWEYLLLVAILCALAFMVVKFVVSSSAGHVVMAIREDEDAIAVFGFRTRHYKLLVWTIAAVLASVAGALYAGFVGFVDPNTFVVAESIVVVAMVIVGGLGSVSGSVLGAVVYVLVQEGTRFVDLPPSVSPGQVRLGLLGLFLLVLLMVRPQGILGRYRI